MALLLGKAVYSILSGDTSLHSILSGTTSDKIYPLFAPDETLNPFIVYSYKTNDVQYTKDGLSFDICSLIVNVVADNYSDSIEIAQLVRNKLERIRGTYSGIDIYECLVSSTNIEFGIDGFITSIEFQVKCKEAEAIEVVSNVPHLLSANAYVIESLYVQLEFDMLMDPAMQTDPYIVDDFEFNINGTPASIDSIQVFDDIIYLVVTGSTWVTTITPEDILTLDIYTGNVKSATGGLLETITNYSVVNGVVI